MKTRYILMSLGHYYDDGGQGQSPCMGVLTVTPQLVDEGFMNVFIRSGASHAAHDNQRPLV